MLRFCFLFQLTVFCQILLAQLPYTQPQFATWVEPDLPYGTATDFAGGEIQLTLDLYRPVADGNCRRPLLVMIHGGAWLAGTKADADVVQVCQEMAARGYVTASINYRLGMHPRAVYQPYAICPVEKCVYVTEALEYERALYRAMQDAKGAIRFLKNRSEMDSTDLDNVFVGGSSAGAFTALSTALLDEPSERPASTFALNDAPLPDADLASCVPAPALRTRPDLGPIIGNLNLGGHDATVHGVAEFMGGLLDTGLLQGPLPPLYLYHRTDDLVVGCRWSRLLPMYFHCIDPLNLCQPNAERPFAAGSCFLTDGLAGMGPAAPPYLADLLDLGNPSGADCLDDPPGHSIANIPLRCANLAGFFAPIIAANGNDPAANCASATPGTTHGEQTWEIFPNPANRGVLHFSSPAGKWENARLALLSPTGQLLATTLASGSQFAWDLQNLSLPTGIYFVKISTATGSRTVKVLLQNP